MSYGESRGSRAGRFALVVAKLGVLVAVLPMLFAILSLDGTRFANALIAVVLVVPSFALIAAAVGFLVPAKKGEIPLGTESQRLQSDSVPSPHSSERDVAEGATHEVVSAARELQEAHGSADSTWKGLSPDATITLFVIVLCGIALLVIWLFIPSPNSGTTGIDYQALQASIHADGSASSTAYESATSEVVGQPGAQPGSSSNSGGLAVATSGVPKFASYSVSALYSGPSAAVRLTGDSDRQFRTRILATSSLPVNFGGEYALSLWGCGAECLMGVAVSKRTGNVVWLPGTICCWRGEGDSVMYRPDSALIVLAGIIGEDSYHGTHFYALIGDEFVHLQSVPVIVLDDG